ncbi:hypothetical protein J6590_067277 [Homalodisca vitripennis]|nr:hypothetical protein J6590_067277 [Homalodisca vitripennis]
MWCAPAIRHAVTTFILRRIVDRILAIANRRPNIGNMWCAPAIRHAVTTFILRRIVDRILAICGVPRLSANRRPNIGNMWCAPAIRHAVTTFILRRIVDRILAICGVPRLSVTLVTTELGVAATTYLRRFTPKATYLSPRGTLRTPLAVILGYDDNLFIMNDNNSNNQEQPKGIWKRTIRTFNRTYLEHFATKNSSVK